MGNERVSKFVIEFDATEGSISQVLSSIRGSVRNAVADIERTAGKLELFGDITRNLPAVQSALDKAKEKVAALRSEIDGIKSTGAVPLKSLTDGLAAAEKAAAGAQREFNKQNAELAKLDAQLRAAKVNTSNLAAEQLRLAQASKVAAAAAEQQAAKQLLGVKTLADIQPALARINAAYETLRTSGTLSVKEIAAAQVQLRARIKETHAEVTGLATSAKAGGGSLASFFSGGILPALGLTASLGTVVSGFRAAIASAHEYQNELARIDTVTNLSKAQLDALGEGARELSVSLGIDLSAAMKGLFDLIRSGIPPENALAVLKTSAEAAKAAMVDTNVGVKAANILVDSFGLSLGDLGGAFDVLANGAKNGGATLTEFSNDATGALGNVAKAANVPFKEVIATLTVMVDKSGDAAGSIATLSKIIVGLNTKAARDQLRGMNIQTTGLIDTFRELAKRDIGLDKILDLGIVSKRSAGSIATLTNNTDDLTPALERAGKAAGTVAEQLGKIENTPQGKLDKLLASLKETAVSIGENATANSTLIPTLTRIVNLYNDFAKAAGKVDTSVTGLVLRLFGLVPAQQSAADTAREMARFTAQAAAGFDAAGKAADENKAKIGAANKELEASATSLLTEIQALQAASTRDIGDIDARANAQIAALDRSVQATAATAAATIAIQTKLAADRLAIIQKNEADVLAAVNAAAAARENILRTQGASEKQIAADIAKIRLDALAPILAQYQQHYNALVALAQQHSAKINSIEAERVSFNQGIEKTLFDIRLQSLSGLDAYAAKVKEIDRLISEARRAGVEGDIAAARKFTDQAIALSGTLREVVNKDGAILIRASEAQATALKLGEKAADGYRDSLDDAQTAAKAGFDATKDGIDAVVPKLEDLKKRYDLLKDTIAEGLDVKVTLDTTSLNSAIAALDRLTAPRTVQITPVVGNAGGGPIVPGFGRGGPIGDFVQRFAGGGSVFRRPSWNKVPGSGSGDTVPAGLQSGSYVLRKAASAFYGDSILSRLARGYAGGGAVRDPTIRFAPAPSEAKFFGDITSGASRDVGEISPPTLPSNPKELLRQVYEYFANVVVAGRRVDGSYWDQTIKAAQAAQKAYERRPTDSGLDRWLQLARTIGLNIGITRSDHQGFDVDGRRWHAEPAQTSMFAGLGLSPGARLFEFFARGGMAGRDTVPAFLTPGEYIFNPRAVAMYGGGLLNALNNMQVPRGFLSNMMNLEPPRPAMARIAHFGDGGPVGSVPRSGNASGANLAGKIEIHLHGIRDDEDYVRTRLIPTLDKIQKRGR